MDKVKYLPHPCSAELKKEWNAKGYKVLDERFNPESVEQEKPKRKRKTKAAD
jgi:hypothetical protein